MSKWNAKEGQKIPKDVRIITVEYEVDLTFEIPDWFGDKKRSPEDIIDWSTFVKDGEWYVCFILPDGEYHIPAADVLDRVKEVLFFDKDSNGVPAKEE